MRPPPYRLNKAHFHVWFLASSGTAFFKARAREGFQTRQAASQWAARREPDREKRMVLACYDPRCGPSMD